MSDRWQKLRGLAEAATPGPWQAVCRDCSNPKNELPWDREQFLQWELDGPQAPWGRGDFFGEDAHFIAAARDAVEPLLAERDQLLAALKAARDALYNGFEPDNQSRAWHAANNAVAAAERLAGEPTE